jgi:hypothetical protein
VVLMALGFVKIACKKCRFFHSSSVRDVKGSLSNPVVFASHAKGIQ